MTASSAQPAASARLEQPEKARDFTTRARERAAARAAHSSSSAAATSPQSSAADPLLSAAFGDAFERSEVGPDWHLTGPVWSLRGGRLCASGARNHPAWLARRLPVNARIEFDATSSSPEGDIKAEFWGDGTSAATGISYTNATSYVVIFGGWKNTFHVLARLDEHARDRTEVHVDPDQSDPRLQPVLADHSYHFKVERSDGRTVRWFVDDIEILSLPDSEPLSGPGHEHFGFNDWQVPVCFDNLTITPLKT